MDAQNKKNEPTWLEYLIVYVVLGAVAVFVYTSVLSPRGYTFAAGWATLRGHKKPEAGKKAAAPAPMKAAAMEADVPAEKPTETPVEMAPPPPMPVEMAPPPPPMPMQLSEDDD